MKRRKFIPREEKAERRESGGKDAHADVLPAMTRIVTMIVMSCVAMMWRSCIPRGLLRYVVFGRTGWLAYRVENWAGA
jgi:hypothetical protein